MQKLKRYSRMSVVFALALLASLLAMPASADHTVAHTLEQDGPSITVCLLATGELVVIGEFTFDAELHAGPDHVACSGTNGGTDDGTADGTDSSATGPGSGTSDLPDTLATGPGTSSELPTELATGFGTSSALPWALFLTLLLGLSIGGASLALRRQ